MTRALVHLMVFGLLTGSAAVAQERQVWTVSGASGAEAAAVPGEARQLEGGQVAGRPVLRLTDVTTPTLEVFPADPARSSDTAVIICPGGGFRILAYDLEGSEVAAWLQGLGITALVLKYRVPAAAGEQRGKRPLEDLRQALRTVRSRAGQLKIDPQKVGVLGFSAGAYLAVISAMQPAATTEDVSELSTERPNFLIPIYPAYLVDPESDRPQLDPSLRIDEKTPPTFMVVTQDDADRAIGAALLMVELKQHGTPAELHVFMRGGHGYGLRVSEDAVSRWPELCERWLRAMGYIEDESHRR